MILTRLLNLLYNKSKIQVLKILLILIACNLVYANKQSKIVTVGGCITETVFALGVGESIIAVDMSSTYPEEVKKLPQVGYIRAISAEGVLSMMPSQILTTTDIGPSNAVSQIINSGVSVQIFESPHSFAGIISLIKDLSSLLSVDERGDLLVKELFSFNLAIDSLKSNISNKPKIAFFMNPSLGSYPAAGEGTRANYLIDYIGGVNAFGDAFSRYKKISKEGIVDSNPDIILVGTTFNHGSTVIDDVFSGNTEFQSVNAVLSKKVFYIDMGKHLTFGPSFPENSYNLLKDIGFESK
tara:strand:- start:81 stop:971 length:891 start_codon:yes stop_codon:yes gene_type:complete